MNNNKFEVGDKIVLKFNDNGGWDYYIERINPTSEGFTVGGQGVSVGFNMVAKTASKQSFLDTIDKIKRDLF
ncbi:hypothetical protein [Bartonella tamiae]|uniref:hypothetical protein n=1 Tax=Bartonella tamiae TaxID=373638 RepID=UPI00026E77B0|nr:hypothetical protein [Bartonella tamiae]EJF92655.1 hypothetical protein MEG_01825 [Bartonella tamiae Th307]